MLCLSDTGHFLESKSTNEMPSSVNVSVIAQLWFQDGIFRFYFYFLNNTGPSVGHCQVITPQKCTSIQCQALQVCVMELI